MLKDNLTRWHQIVEEKNWDGLNELLHDEVSFHSPFVWKPKEGKQITAMILSNVLEVMQHFTYHREWEDGETAVLEFTAEVEGLSLKGIDLITFDDQGKITHFEVLIRPGNALMKVGQLMTERVNQHMGGT